jgi:hypothetical protein
LKKKKLTNKERDEIIGMLWKGLLEVRKEILETRQHFAVYLDYREKVFKEEIEDYNKFVTGIVEEFEKKQRSEDKKGA